MSELTLSVTQLNNYIKKIIDAEEILFGISIVGEITNLKQSGRSTYFDIKDDNSSLPCVVFNDTVLIGIKTGDKVTLKGQLNFYAKNGKLSFIVSKATKFGVGELYQKFMELKEKLKNEGVFDDRHKKSIPEVSKRIGIVTSETGAVIHDIINVTQSKNRNIDLVLFPAKVQGVGAVEEIINGIKFLDQHNVDLIIIARGGGSFEDYAPFNTEEIVRAVFETKKPVISAIGHENDWSLIDFVADLRAGTPSIAAEIAVFDMEGFKKSINFYSSRIINSITKVLNFNKNAITNFSNKILTNSKIHLKSSSFKLISLLERQTNEVTRIYESNKKHFELATSKIELNNPLTILKKGYASIAYDGKKINSIKQIEPGYKIDLLMSDGKAVAQIIEKKEYKL